MKTEFLDFLRNEPDLSALKQEVQRQQEWLRQLHNHSKELHKYSDYIFQSNVRHKKEIIEQINSITKWIEHFNETNLAMKREIFELKVSIRKTLKKDFEAYHNMMRDYLALKLNEHDTIKEDRIKEKIKDEILNELNKPKIEIPLVQQVNIEPSNPEKEVLNLLFNENKPLTYEQLAEKLNKSVNSVRVYMNSLKVKKPVIDEFVTPSGSKVFSIKNAEMVKTLFALNTH
jgi:hypothetical protein